MPTNPRERLERLQSVAKVEFQEGSIDLTFGKPMLFPGVETYEEMIGMLADDAMWALRVCEAAIEAYKGGDLSSICSERRDALVAAIEDFRG